MRQNRRLPARRGNVLVLTVLLMVCMMGILALSIDVGYLYVVDSEMQRSADAAAMSAAWDLLARNVNDTSPEDAALAARASADRFASLNLIGGDAPGLADNDVEIGYLADFTNPSAALDTSDASRFNAVRLRVRRTNQQNGEVPLYFARVLGYNSAPLDGRATATFINNFRGFRIPSSGENLEILPFALDEETWEGLSDPNATKNDDFTWDQDAREIRAGGDGVYEANLFPQGTGSPGNRGTVDIGSNNNSTRDLERQIRHGISKEDLDYIGGSLEFNDAGELYLNGDTGISAGMKDALAAIKGQPRIIPIFRSVTGPGNNATYTIVKFVGVRILHVDMSGSSKKTKKVIIQPADVVLRGGIPDTGPARSDFVYSPVWLVR